MTYTLKTRWGTVTGKDLADASRMADELQRQNDPVYAAHVAAGEYARKYKTTMAEARTFLANRAAQGSEPLVKDTEPPINNTLRAADTSDPWGQSAAEPLADESAPSGETVDYSDPWRTSSGASWSTAIIVRGDDAMWTASDDSWLERLSSWVTAVWRGDSDIGW